MGQQFGDRISPSLVASPPSLFHDGLRPVLVTGEHRQNLTAAFQDVLYLTSVGQQPFLRAGCKPVISLLCVLGQTEVETHDYRKLRRAARLTSADI